MKSSLKFISICAFLGIGLTSCVEDIDTDQLDDIIVTQTVEASLISVTVPESSLSPFTVPYTLSEFIDYGGFQSDVISDNLYEAELYFEFQNSMARDFDIRIDFLDAANQVLESQIFYIPAASSQTVTLNRTVFYDNTEVISLLNTTGFFIEFLTDSDASSSLENPQIDINTSAKLYTLID